MSERVYTSAMGKPIDMRALAIKNQGVPAVGNMNVDASGKPLKAASFREAPRPAPQQVQATRITNVQRVPVDATSTAARQRLEREEHERLLRVDQERVQHETQQAALVQAVVVVDSSNPEDIESTLMFSADQTSLEVTTESAKTRGNSK